MSRASVPNFVPNKSKVAGSEYPWKPGRTRKPSRSNRVQIRNGVYIEIRNTRLASPESPIQFGHLRPCCLPVRA
ncbi:hypothetical protein VNO78_20273 [Psophocarpus tetragonolobus]|uniref:Uncharacterized protein n=1 Tax=Psophocarpus tetragonolobus TaxID=3891 RepID=A0AAN9SB15_PSOTE